MDLELLKCKWTKPAGEYGDLQAKIWDGRAEDYSNKAIPTVKDNLFLKYLFEKAKPDLGMSVLDIGCGAGRFTIALAEYVKEAVGVDVSPKMIEAAGKSAGARNLSNIHFEAGDWSVWDLEKAGFKNKFDLVFAHMTPAISDYDTMNKMNECAKGHCFLVKPARRKDFIQDTAFELIGITEQKSQLDDGISNAFTYLWQRGYNPELSYRDEVWEREMTTEQMCDWCVNRAKLQKSITKEQEEQICRYIQENSADGKIKEKTTTTIVTIYWHV